MKRLFLIALSTLLCSVNVTITSVASEITPKTIEVDGDLVIKGKRINYVLEIKLSKATTRKLRSQVKTRIFGGGGRRESSEVNQTVDRIQLTIDGLTFVVPKEGLVDLTYPNLPRTLNIVAEKKNIVISFGGSEGEFAYNCRFYASSRKFVKRIVTEPLNPRYQNVVLKF